MSNVGALQVFVARKQLLLVCLQPRRCVATRTCHPTQVFGRPGRQRGLVGRDRRERPRGKPAETQRPQEKRLLRGEAKRGEAKRGKARQGGARRSGAALSL